MGEWVPTLRQLEGLAKRYRRPLGMFFRPKLPVVPALATKYRRLPVLSSGQESPELRLAIRRMSNRREGSLGCADGPPIDQKVAHHASCHGNAAQIIRLHRLGSLSEVAEAMGCGDYIEQLNYLIFLKTTDEYAWRLTT